MSSTENHAAQDEPPKSVPKTDDPDSNPKSEDKEDFSSGSEVSTQSSISGDDSGSDVSSSAISDSPVFEDGSRLSSIDEESDDHDWDEEEFNKDDIPIAQVVNCPEGLVANGSLSKRSLEGEDGEATVKHFCAEASTSAVVNETVKDNGNDNSEMMNNNVPFSSKNSNKNTSSKDNEKEEKSLKEKGDNKEASNAEKEVEKSAACEVILTQSPSNDDNVTENTGITSRWEIKNANNDCENSKKKEKEPAKCVFHVKRPSSDENANELNFHSRWESTKAADIIDGKVDQEKEKKPAVVYVKRFLPSTDVVAAANELEAARVNRVLFNADPLYRSCHKCADKALIESLKPDQQPLSPATDDRHCYWCAKQLYKPEVTEVKQLEVE